ncbi:hypothetical protein ABZ671_10710 [Micromonospora sp. NPDC006766]|uniref:hypothetical protein n=1 Tax=Micromonospora sp. NPDC006766 TaxID=3154778 RepID=UPI00340D9319
MSGFFVDPNGLNGLYNLLHRASGDAADVLEYTKRHCDLIFGQEGLLLHVAGPHHTAYQQMTQGLEKLKTLTRDAATQINLAQREYATSDGTAAARLDQSYPGAPDPTSLRSSFPTGRPDLWASAPRAAFTDVAEPAGRLVAPNYATGIEMFQINPLSDLLSPAAWLRQISVWLFREDPFDGWTGAGDVPEVWRGNAAEAEQQYQHDLGAATCAFHPVCRQYADLYTQAAEAAKHLFSVVTVLISKLIDLLIIVNLASAAGTAAIEPASVPSPATASPPTTPGRHTTCTRRSPPGTATPRPHSAPSPAPSQWSRPTRQSPPCRS